jgi:hypothetical protein
MGWTWQVLEWTEDFLDEWKYISRYEGESFIRALITMRRLKKQGGLVMSKAFEKFWSESATMAALWGTTAKDKMKIAYEAGQDQAHEEVNELKRAEKARVEFLEDKLKEMEVET